jgi:outer membrane protein assembly factor BamB
MINWGDQARPRHQFLAMDKRTGDCVWMNGTNPLPKETTYSAPTVTVLNGQKSLVFGSGDGSVWAFQPRTGKPIWEYKLSARFVTMAPLVVGDTVFAGHAEENIAGTKMGAMAAMNGASVGDITSPASFGKRNVMLGRLAGVCRRPAVLF